MMGIRRLTVAVVVIGAGLLAPSAASAGPLKDGSCSGDCLPPSYSPFRYWAPRLAKWYDNCHGPRLDVYAPDRHPEIPPNYDILRFSCPAVDPAATLIEPPQAPATSRFRY
jgi:hypothetical protein